MREILQKYIGNVNSINKLTEDSATKLCKYLYPNIDSVNDVDAICQIDILERAFQLNYDTDTLVEILLKTNMGYYLYMYMSMKYARDDVYFNIINRFNVDKEFTSYNINSLNKIAGYVFLNDKVPIDVKISLLKFDKTFSNYLLYTDDNVKMENHLWSISLLLRSEHPKLLFQKYQDNFLLNDVIKNSYHNMIGNNTMDKYVPYLLNDGENKISKDEVDYLMADPLVGSYILRSENRLVLKIYNIKNDNDCRALAKYLSVYELECGSMWNLLDTLLDNIDIQYAERFLRYVVYNMIHTNMNISKYSILAYWLSRSWITDDDIYLIDRII
ncbi:Hypothetical protein ORPV_841 [Orpheovirus IHUMI-LCC2]|uniref:Uncharacterized protein n=1 Tax=Orpheovirus IHUMI-LCC2 TaxID=2023057 RepID=A0A2I2L5B3_9VIRU|nr:Hypothetical protein ORPV_841 [Orpheovirus IHUMI-LCC2]SNW62745.1 Hypothetical protein ORPV_841 [Orpheovirus IHUMI-LCC2]